MNKTTIAIIVTIVAFAIAIIASSATDNLPKGVTKFQDGDITCYRYSKSISCVMNPKENNAKVENNYKTPLIPAVSGSSRNS